jgi:hypothetical protein
MNNTVSSIASKQSKSIQVFLDSLFQPTDLILIRFVESSKGRKSKYHGHAYGTPKWIANNIQRLDAYGAKYGSSVYFGVCRREGRDKDKKADIRTVRSLWADFDYCSVEDATTRITKAGLPYPSIVVNSGHGVHAYWLLAESIHVPLASDRERLEATLQGIKEALGTDHVQDLTRLLRLPFTTNRKNLRNKEAVVACVLVSCDSSLRYRLEDFPLAKPTALIRTARVQASTKQEKATQGIDQTLEVGELCEDWKEVFARWQWAIRQASNNPYAQTEKSERRSGIDWRFLIMANYKGIPASVVWSHMGGYGRFAQRGYALFVREWNRARQVWIDETV